MNEKWLGKKLREKLTRFRFYPFEHCAQQSVPDLYTVHPRTLPFWIELKAVASLDCKIEFRRGQAAWHRDHWSAGGRSCIAVLIQVPGYVAIFPGSEAPLLASGKVRDFPSMQASWSPLSGPECWARVANSFLGLFFVAREPVLARPNQPGTSRKVTPFKTAG